MDSSSSQSFRDIKKILIMKLKHIGDVLLTTPCIRALHDAFPNAKISFLVNEGTEAMLQNHPLLEEIIIFPRSSMKTTLFKRVDREWKFACGLRAKAFDMTVDLTSADRAAWLSWFSGARYRLAHDPRSKGFFGKKCLYTHVASPPAHTDTHEVLKNLNVLSTFGLSIQDPRLELHLLPQDYLLPKQFLQEWKWKSRAFAVVHPTSRWLFKCWDDERFANLVDWLQREARLPVVLTCGPDKREIARTKKVLSFCQTSPKYLTGELRLTEWAALVKEARLFIGVDSAPMHIAASQRTPTLALFGPTGHHHWRPWAAPHTVLVRDCPCSRDRQAHCDWSDVRACMKEITLEETIDATRRLLSDTER